MAKSLTKEKELELLDKTIKRFGEDSYIGKWLAKERENIVWAISNDFPIDVAIILNSAHLPTELDL